MTCICIFLEAHVRRAAQCRGAACHEHTICRGKGGATDYLHLYAGHGVSGTFRLP